MKGRGLRTKSDLSAESGLKGCIVKGVLILRQTEPQRLLRVVCEDKIPIYISHLSGQRWHIARAVVVGITEKYFDVEIGPQRLSWQVCLQQGQSVGITFKYSFDGGYGRFVLGTTVAEVRQREDYSGALTLMMPDEIDVIQRRSFERVRPPEGVNIDVNVWSRNFLRVGGQSGPPRRVEVSQSWTGRLVDISAGGMAVAISHSQGPAFEAGQFVRLKFIPIPGETPLAFSAYVKTVSQTADGGSLCLGLATVGLEASSEGRLVLQRLCNVVEQYSQMNSKSRIQNN